MKYDYLIVGAGLYGSMFAYLATQKGKRCLVVEKHNHVGGFCYTENMQGIEVHKYGAHIFHTSNKKVWDFVNTIDTFCPFINSPLAFYNGRLYHLPFNMNTFYELWGITSPKQAIEKIMSDRVMCDNPQNLEEYALSVVGREIYEKLIKGYTEKQWGKSCRELPVSIIKRLPLRFTFNNNYFNDNYQGVPIHGYTYFIRKLLAGSTLFLLTDYLENEKELNNIAENIVYTGPVDALCDYRFGCLEYRCISLTHSFHKETANYQGNAVINYTDSHVPYTRTIEHRHFVPSDGFGTVVSFEYPNCGNNPAYPICDKRNITLYERYKEFVTAYYPNIILGGRLAEYKYFDMDDVIINVTNQIHNLV